MNLVVQLSGFDLADSQNFAAAVKRLIEGLVQRNREYLRRRPSLRLYTSGVLYARDPKGVVSLADVPTCLARKWGHCAHLSAWLVAELNERGSGATIRMRWPIYLPDFGGHLYHVQVRLPKNEGFGPPGLGQIDDPTNQEGQILDPSRMLGMGRFPSPELGLCL